MGRLLRIFRTGTALSTRAASDLKAHAAESDARAQANLADAERRRDTRAIGAARKARQATLHEVLRLGA